MKRTLTFVLLALYVQCLDAWSQTELTGVWRVSSGGESAPAIVLRVEGETLTGSVRVGGMREIFDGKASGGAITFKVDRPAADLIMTFDGRLRGDSIAFTRRVEVQPNAVTPPSPNVNLLLFPPQFSVIRVPENEWSELDRAQVAFTDQVKGVELAAAVNMPANNVKVLGTLFLPNRVSRVRAVIVAVGYGRGRSFFWDDEIRRVAERAGAGVLLATVQTVTTPISGTPRDPAGGGGEGLRLLLERFAGEASRPELARVPLLLWAHSGAGGFAIGFASLYPARTIGFIRYQSGPGWKGDMKVLSRIPALFVAASTDSEGTVNGAMTLWKQGRSAGAPWGFAIQQGAQHGSEEDLKKANTLVAPWIAAVINLRVVNDQTTLSSIEESSGWLGNSQSGDAAPSAAYRGVKIDAAWFPDERSVQGWRSLAVLSK